MVILAVLYLLLVWLVFVQLKLLRWGWGTGTATVILGIAVCAVFAGFLGNLAPSGNVTVISRVVEVTPNVSGEIVEIPVKANEPVKAGGVLFKMEPAPYRAQVRLIEAQLKFQELRHQQMTQLQASGSGRSFDVQQREAEIDQLKAQLEKATYDLDQTTVHAPADGYVTNLALSKGDRASSSKAVMSFIVSDEIQIVGIFPQNGFKTIKPGAKVQFALSAEPGRIYTSTVGAIVSGVGEGQVLAGGNLTKVTGLAMTTEYPALLNKPDDLDKAALRPGMSGTATVYAPNSAPFDFFGWVLLYGRALALYL